MKLENQIQIFNNPEFGQIRTILINGEIWFVAADVCRALDLTNTTMALKSLSDDEKSKIEENRITIDHNYLWSTVTPFVENDNPFLKEINIVNEPGLYHLNFMSRKPNAKKFQHWVYHEVLPSIRKLGIYTTQEIINKIFESAKFAEKFQNLKCVYAFEMNNDTLKIGYTQNVRQRMNTIISSSGLDIVNFYHTDFIDSEIAYLIEQTCHANFDSCRVRGEFFCVSFEEACLELDKIFKEFYKFGKT